MDDYQPLACDLYDYLEIACMHRYQLAIELVDGSHLEQRLRMDRLLAITPQDAGASFGRVLLSGNRC
ncbi:MAG: transcriptional antiterminator [Pseudomonas sp. 34-62-33]|nr:MAG: transcriptional antiterminator [Pseudomonas sp. 34-62-33]